MNAVHEKSDKEWDGFIQSDVSVRWWVSYMFLAYKDLTESKMQHMFDLLATKDVSGPKLRIPVPESWSITPVRWPSQLFVI